MNVAHKIPAPIPRLPLWRLEMMREQALRRFQRAEAEHMEAARELQRVQDEINARRQEQA